MQETLRKTLNLTKEHPQLLLPLVVSCWLTYYLEWFQKAATHFILHRFLIGHSVMGFDVPQPDPTYAYVHKAMALLAPFSFAISFLLVALSVIGLVLTARLARELLTGEVVTWRKAAQFLAGKKWQAALFTLASQITVVGAGALVAMVAPLLVTGLRHPFQMVRISSYVVLAFYAWFALPFALRLISARDERPPSTKAILWGRCVAIAAGILLVLVADGVKIMAAQINLSFADAPLLRDHIVLPLIGIASSLPLGLLWIYLGVLQSKGPETVEAPSPL
jgi:hypothetical protein